MIDIDPGNVQGFLSLVVVDTGIGAGALLVPPEPGSASRSQGMYS